MSGLTALAKLDLSWCRNVTTEVLRAVIKYKPVVTES